jgi:hypothetical protein
LALLRGEHTLNTQRLNERRLTCNTHIFGVDGPT